MAGAGKARRLSAGKYRGEDSLLPYTKVRRESEPRWKGLPYWAYIVGLVIFAMGLKVFLDVDYDLARKNIFPGIWLTIRATLIAFGLALLISLVVGLGQISKNVVARNLSRAFIELVRGIPVLPLIFVLSLIIIPDISEAAGAPNSVPNDLRAILALALIYGAYMAEIIRGGVQSIPRGQMEAGRALGLSSSTTMRSVIFPQAARAIIPPMANDFIAILKDTSLLSILGVLEVTRRTRQYSASSFKFREAFFTMTFVYLVLVIGLSILLSMFERRFTRDRVGER